MLARLAPFHLAFSELNYELPNIVSQHQMVDQIILNEGKNDIRREEPEILKKNFTEMFNTLEKLTSQRFISGPLTARGINTFSQLINLNTWLRRTCSLRVLNYMYSFLSILGVQICIHFYLFWRCRYVFISIYSGGAEKA